MTDAASIPLARLAPTPNWSSLLISPSAALTGTPSRSAPRAAATTTAQRASQSVQLDPAARCRSCRAKCVRHLLARPSCMHAPFAATGADIPLEAVRRTLLLGRLRESFDLINPPDAQLIGSLRYFEGPMEKVRGGSLPAVYWHHVETNLERCEQHWRTQPAPAPSRQVRAGERP